MSNHRDSLVTEDRPCAKIEGSGRRWLSRGSHLPLALSALFRRSSRKCSPPVTPNIQERRASERIAVNLPVLIGPCGLPGLTGSLINLSLSGAAIEIHDFDIAMRTVWFREMNQSDELLVMGLLDTPVVCHVVVFDNGVLIVHFLPETRPDTQLVQYIEKLKLFGQTRDA